MAAVLFAAGTKGKRYALPHSRFLLHQPIGSASGQAKDIMIDAKEIMRVREELNKILSLHTGQPIKKIEVDTDRNFWMSADEAVKYGLADKVVVRRKEVD